MKHKTIKRRDFLKATTAGSLFVTTSLLSANNKKEDPLSPKENLITDFERREGPSYYRAVALKNLGGFDIKWLFKDG